MDNLKMHKEIVVSVKDPSQYQMSQMHLVSHADLAEKPADTTQLEDATARRVPMSSTNMREQYLKMH